MRREMQLNGRTIVIAGEPSNTCIIQPLELRELALLQNELDIINEAVVEQPYLFVGIVITEWNGDLSPWSAPPVFGNKDFGGYAPKTLDYIEKELLPYLQHEYHLDETARFLLGGYSLAGLFSLWASTKTDVFTSIVAASPSVWFPQWDEYVERHPTKAKSIYLSLGDEEPLTKNQIMAKSGAYIRHLHQILTAQLGEGACTLEWNKGGHFQFPEKRVGKGFRWLIEN